MRCFFDNKSEGIFLIHGNLHDLYFSVDGKHSFNEVLNNTLKVKGYKTVFFSGTNICNLFCLDKDSANFFIDANREENYKKDQSENVDFSDGGLSFDNGLDQQTHYLDYDDMPDKTIMEQPGISSLSFIDDAISHMKNHSKIAIVFTNFYDFISKNEEAVRYQELLANYWSDPVRKKDNLIIFLAPNNSIKLHQCRDLQNSLGWGGELWDENGRLNPRNCVYVGAPCEDEFLHMVQHMAEYGEQVADGDEFVRAVVSDEGDDYTFNPKKKYVPCAKLLQQIAHDNDLLLKDIYIHIWKKICDDPQHILSTKKINEWYHLQSEDESPLESLNKPGWEKPYKRLKTFYDAYGEYNTSGISQKELNVISSYSTIARLCSIDIEKKSTGIPNFVLTGNPGVGKTEVARLIGKILNRCGFLQIGHTHEVTKADLVSSYRGDTPQKTLHHIEAANGGVLFIDEAPGLAAKDGGADSEQTGRDVLREIVSAMTNPHYNFCLILSGYAEPMEAVFELEPGLRSRISQQNIIQIDDCSPMLLEKICLERIQKIFPNAKLSDELTNEGESVSVEERVKVLDNTLREQGGSLEQNSNDSNLSLIDRLFYNIYRSRIKSQFGNARESIKIADDVITELQSRSESPKVICCDDFGEERRKHFIKKENSSFSEIEDALKSFVGERIRTTVMDAMNEIRLSRTEAKVRNPNTPIDQLPHPKSMIFSGHPGTGKTEIARLFGELYCQLQILGNASILEVNASELVGDAIGVAAENTKKTVKKAYDQDALLFIDEAHQLCDTHSYGKNVMDALMAPMTDSEHPLSVIFAIYPDRLKDFLKLNPGLDSRVQIIPFEDYTANELMQIFIVKEKLRNFTVDECDDFHNDIELLLENLYDARDCNFGNGRVVANLLDEVCSKRRMRIGFNEEDIRKSLQNGPTVQDIPEKYRSLIEEQRKHREKLKSQQNILGELENMSGYDGIKQIIHEKQNQIKFNKILEERGLPVEPIYPGHYCFLGNPGCGKSTGAKMLASSFYQMGIISGSRYMVCSAKDLIGEYVGTSGGKTAKVLMDSLDGVLLIDEAYELRSSYGKSDFNAAALTEIVAFMDNPLYRYRSCIILAGYPEQMRELYKDNLGLKSRLCEVAFKDYDNDALWNIFKGTCQKNNLTLFDEARSKDIFNRKMEELRNDPSEIFANGRTVRNFFDLCMINRRRRILRHLDTENLTELLPEDFDDLDKNDGLEV